MTESPWKTLSREQWDAEHGEGDFDKRLLFADYAREEGRREAQASLPDVSECPDTGARPVCMRHGDWCPCSRTCPCYRMGDCDDGGMRVEKKWQNRAKRPGRV